MSLRIAPDASNRPGMPGPDKSLCRTRRSQPTGSQRARLVPGRARPSWDAKAGIRLRGQRPRSISPPRNDRERNDRMRAASHRLGCRHRRAKSALSIAVEFTAGYPHKLQMAFAPFPFLLYIRLAGLGPIRMMAVPGLRRGYARVDVKAVVNDIARKPWAERMDSVERHAIRGTTWIVAS